MATRLGVTCIESSGSSGSSSVGSEDIIGGDSEGDLGLNARGGRDRRAEAPAEEHPILEGWTMAMTPARFIDYVGGRDICPAETLQEGLHADASSVEERHGDDGDMNLCRTPAAGAKSPRACVDDDAASETNVPVGTFEKPCEAAAEGRQVGEDINTKCTGDIKVGDLLKKAGDHLLDIHPAFHSHGATRAFDIEVKRKLRTDPSMRVRLSEGSETEPPSMQMSSNIDLSSAFKPSKIIQLGPGSLVRAVSVNAFAVTASKGKPVTFVAGDRRQRDLWMTAVKDCIELARNTGTFEEGDTSDGSASPTSAADHASDVMDFQTSFLRMQPRKVALSDSVLTICKLTKDGGWTGSCEPARKGGKGADARENK
eukprot:jgi/Undpi1/13497/HiC_scaffold_8.g03156.m1